MAPLRDFFIRTDIDVEASSLNLLWWGGESVQIDGSVFHRGIAATFPAGTCLLQAWDADGILHIHKPGTFNESSSSFSASLAPTESNLPPGTYTAMIRIKDATPTDVSVVWQGKIVVKYSPALSGVGYVGTSGPLNYQDLNDSKIDGTVAPTVTDDSAAGWFVGSRWLDVVASKEYVCLDPSVGAAVWIETTGGGGGGDNLGDHTATEDLDMAGFNITGAGLVDGADVAATSVAAFSGAAHAGAFGNPHGTTAEQTGAVPIAGLASDPGLLGSVLSTSTAGSFLKINNNLGAATAPTVSNDASEFYSEGSRWLDTTNGKEYVCFDTTVGAAIWVETTGAAGSSDSTTLSAKVNEAGGVSMGQVVYISGATGGFAQVSLASNDDFSKADVLAIATETKSDNQTVSVVRDGLLEGLDTSAFSEGDILYLGTAGAITATHPPGIDAVQRIGHAVKINASTGSILVELNPLTFIHSIDGTIRHQLVNPDPGIASASSYTLVNDMGKRASFSLFGSNTFSPNAVTFYNEGHGLTAFTNDGNTDFLWLTDVTDSHNFLSTVKMTLTAAGELQVQRLSVLDGDINLAERADHLTTVASGKGIIWLRDDKKLIFTDDAGTDTVLGAGGGGSSDWSVPFTAQNFSWDTDNASGAIG